MKNENDSLIKPIFKATS